MKLRRFLIGFLTVLLLSAAVSAAEYSVMEGICPSSGNAPEIIPSSNISASWRKIGLDSSKPAIGSPPGVSVSYLTN